MILTLYLIFMAWWFAGCHYLHLLDPSVTVSRSGTRNVALLLLIGPAGFCAVIGSKVFDLVYKTPPSCHLHLVKTHRLEPKVPNPTPGKLIIKVRRAGT